MSQLLQKFFSAKAFYRSMQETNKQDHKISIFEQNTCHHCIIGGLVLCFVVELLETKGPKKKGRT